MPDSWTCAACRRPNPKALAACRYCGLGAGLRPTGNERLARWFHVEYAEIDRGPEIETQFESDAAVHARAGYVPTRKLYQEGGRPRNLSRNLSWLFRRRPGTRLVVEYTRGDDVSDDPWAS